jgi:hypothetical protein
MFAYAVGLWPFKDNFHTAPGQHMHFGERWPFEEALVSPLSAGLAWDAERISLTSFSLKSGPHAVGAQASAASCDTVTLSDVNGFS